MSKQQIAIVTGGASGLGRAICDELVRDRVFVVVADLNEEAARKAVDEIKAVGGEAEPFQIDVSVQADVERMIDDVVARHGQLDYMFNNAGFAIAGDTIEMTTEQWRRILGVNLDGCIWGTMAAYRVMARQKFGHIINTASVAGLSPLPLSTPYSTTKHAVVGLSRSLRPEARWYGVKVSVACPGFIQTKLFDHGVGLGSMTFKATTEIGARIAIPADRAAKMLMKGVKRNQDIIVFPFHGKVLYWIQCWAQWFGRLFARNQINKFHRRRQAAEQSREATQMPPSS